MFNRILSVLLFAAAVLIIAPEPSSAQLTCGWCQEVDHWWHPRIHGFPNGGDACMFDGPEDAVCARCGGESHCHGFLSWHALGPCHTLCGPAGGDGGSFARAISSIREGLATKNLDVVAAMVARDAPDLSIEYLPDAGRIELILPCDPVAPAHTIPVAPDMRLALDRRVATALVAVASPAMPRARRYAATATIRD